MKSPIVFCILLIIISISACSDKLPEITYEEYQTQVNELEMKGDLKEAVELSLYAMKLFKNNEFIIMKEIIRLNDKLGQHNDNMELWKRGHDKGYFFLIHPELPQYKAYLELEGFNEIAEKDIELRAAAVELSHCKYIVNIDKEYSKKPYPLIIVLHGGGNNIFTVQDNWKFPLIMKEEYAIAYIQSYRYYDYNTFGWRSGDEKAQDEIEAILVRIFSEYNIDRDKVYIFGMSVGASMALDLGLSDIINCKGIYAVCPTIPSSFNTDNLKNLINASVFITAGSEDKLLSEQKTMAESMLKSGVNVKMTIVEHMGHAIPANHEEILNIVMNHMCSN